MKKHFVSFNRCNENREVFKNREALTFPKYKVKIGHDIGHIGCKFVLIWVNCGNKMFR